MCSVTSSACISCDASSSASFFYIVVVVLFFRFNCSSIFSIQYNLVKGLLCVSILFNYFEIAFAVCHSLLQLLFRCFVLFSLLCFVLICVFLLILLCIVSIKCLLLSLVCFFDCTFKMTVYNQYHRAQCIKNNGTGQCGCEIDRQWPNESTFSLRFSLIFFLMHWKRTRAKPKSGSFNKKTFRQFWFFLTKKATLWSKVKISFQTHAHTLTTNGGCESIYVHII